MLKQYVVAKGFGLQALMPPSGVSYRRRLKIQRQFECDLPSMYELVKILSDTEQRVW